MFYNLNCQYLDSLAYIALAFLTVCSFYDNIRFGPASVDVKHELQLVLNTTGASTGNYSYQPRTSYHNDTLYDNLRSIYACYILCVHASKKRHHIVCLHESIYTNVINISFTCSCHLRYKYNRITQENERKRTLLQICFYCNLFCLCGGYIR